MKTLISALIVSLLTTSAFAGEFTKTTYAIVVKGKPATVKAVVRNDGYILADKDSFQGFRVPFIAKFADGTAALIAGEADEAFCKQIGFQASAQEGLWGVTNEVPTRKYDAIIRQPKAGSAELSYEGDYSGYYMAGVRCK